MCKVHARRCDEPVPVRLFGRPAKAVRLPATGRNEIPGQDFGTYPRPDRPANLSYYFRLRFESLNI